MQKLVGLRPLGKKGAIGPNAVISIMLAIAVIVIVSVMIFSINQGAREDYVSKNTGVNCGQNASGGTLNPAYTACGAGYNATESADLGVSKVTDNLDLVGLGIAFGFVISIILGAIAVKSM